ncbi:MAG: RsmE family RNA methyltransferase [Acholeplasmataceae bacterium]|nr:RsmE family RNA methyltransferase [Acholeplasmataceae bacterium]
MPQRYFVEKNNLIITCSDAHHIKKVMRMKTGDEIIICHDGKCFLSILDLDTEEVKYKIIEELIRKDSPKITLIQGLPKNPKSDIVIKYATIFGASKIILAGMHRSITKLDNEENKIKRFQTIAKEAAELAHRFEVPEIEMIKSLDKMDLSFYDIVLLADESEKSTTLEIALPSIKKEMNIALIIGPEGGISESERISLLSKKVVPVTLGHYILPTEIANLYILTYLSVKNI